MQARGVQHAEKAGWGSLRLVGFVLLAVLLLWPSRLLAQVETADILGRVQDVSKALVPGAIVQVTNLDTGLLRKDKSNSAGEFTITALPIGRYSISIISTGFATYEVPEVTLSQGDRLRVDATLTIGATEVVEVASAEPELQTDSATVGAVVTEREVEDLPLDGRNFMELAQVLAGTNEGPPNALNSGTRPDDRRLTSSVSANGQDENANNQLIDGLDNNERIIGAIGARPSVDAIAEFRVQTNLYTAEVGRSAGAIINIITKAGTNAYHGSMYEFFRNDIFDASNWGSLSHTELRQNQYGASIGGPIKKNKLFFFADYEGYRQVQALTMIATVPTCFERANIGNFSDVSHTSITNPALIDPVGLAYWQLYPLPNTQNNQAVGCPGNTQTARNYVNSPNRVYITQTGDGRTDYAFSNGDHAFVRYTINQGNIFTPGELPLASTYAGATVTGVTLTGGQPIGGTVTGGTLVSGISPGGNIYAFAGTSNQLAMNSQVDYVKVFTPTLLGEFRAGYTYIDNHALPLNYGQNFASALGLKGANLGDPGTSQLTPVQPQGYAAVGDGIFLPLENRDNTVQGNAQFTLQHGKQSIKSGGALVRRHATSAESSYAAGLLTMGTCSSTSNCPLYTGSNSSAPLGSLLRGTVYEAQRSNQLVQPGFRTWEPSGYVQDDWRILSRLTLNLGVRYDVYTPFTEAHGRLSNYNPFTHQLLVPGTHGVGATAGVNTDYTNVAPRIGFAILAAPKTVLRGGFGLSYIPISSGAKTSLGNAPYVFNYQTLKNTTTLAQGLPVPVVQPPDNLNASLAAGLTLSGVDPGYRSTYIEQFNITLQQDFGHNAVQITYVGEIGKRLRQNPNLNLTAPGLYTGASSLPFYSLYPNVTTVNEMISEGYSTYNALQTTYTRRFTHNFGINANYTWAHSLNNAPNYAAGYGGNGVEPYAEGRLDYGNSDLDIRNRAAILLNYSFPFGASAHGLKARLIKGWQVNVIGIESSGLPFSVTDDTVEAETGATSERSMLIGSPSIVTGTGCAKTVSGVTTTYHASDLRTPNFFFNTCAFASQTAGAYVPSYRNGIYGPHFRTLNLSGFKTFPIHENYKLQFRAETFNLTNTPNFANPDSGLGDAAFGQITNTRGGYTPRQIQLALKLLF